MLPTETSYAKSRTQSFTIAIVVVILDRPSFLACEAPFGPAGVNGEPVILETGTHPIGTDCLNQSIRGLILELG